MDSKIIQIAAASSKNEGEITDCLYMLTEAGDVWCTWNNEDFWLVLRGGLPTEGNHVR
jgi:hypothetical protein